jgi:hypothetical protein
MLPEKSVPENYLSFCIHIKRRTEARCKDLVEVAVKFVRRETWRRKEREISISCSPCRRWEQRLKMVAPNSYFYIGELRKIHLVKDNGSGWLRWLTKQRGITLSKLNHTHNPAKSQRQ